MKDQSATHLDGVTGIMPWRGAAVSVFGVLVISGVTAMIGHLGRSGGVRGDLAFRLVPSGLVFALVLLVVSALVCFVPLLVRQFPQLRSPLFYGTVPQLRNFLDWFLTGFTAFALATFLGVIGLTEPRGISIWGAMVFGLGALLFCIGIGYPHGGPEYDGPLPFVAVVTEEFARFWPLQKYGTSFLGILFLATGAWFADLVLFALGVVGAAVLWVVPWLVSLVRALRIEQENQV